MRRSSRSAEQARAVGGGRAAASATLALVVALGAVSAGDHDPAEPGPFVAGRLTLALPTAAGTTRATDVHFPEAGDGSVDPAAGRAPVVVFGHGFTRSKERYRDFGALLASRGIVTLVPDLPCGFLGCDHSANADELRGLLDWILERDLDPSSMFHDRIERGAIGASGHSAGGMWSLVAAGRDPRIVAVAPLDPVDSGGLGAASVASARAAIGPIWAESSSCNAQGSAEALFAAAPAPRRGVLVANGTHCDPEINADVLGCTLVCGFWNAERHRRFLRYASAWFGYHLRCDAADRPWVDGVALLAESDDGLIDVAVDLRPPAPPPPAAHVEGTTIRLVRDPPPWCGARDLWRVFRDSGGGLALVADGLPPDLVEWVDADVEPGRTYRYVLQDAILGAAGEYVADAAPVDVALPAAAPDEPAIVGMERAAGTALRVDVSAAACASGVSLHWFVASGPLAGVVPWSGAACDRPPGTPLVADPGPLPPGDWIGMVAVGTNGEAEGSYGRASDGAERPPSGACAVEQRLDPPCPP